MQNVNTVSIDLGELEWIQSALRARAEEMDGASTLVTVSDAERGLFEESAAIYRKLADRLEYVDRIEVV